jgi:uncharacterized protein
VASGRGVISGRIRTDDPTGTTARTARHFAHKVEVERDGEVERIRIPAGSFELEPADDEVRIRLFPVDEASTARLREVVASHLERFDRSGGAVEWSD